MQYDTPCHWHKNRLACGIQGRLDQDSAAFAKGHKAVCLFVNDDGGAPVSAFVIESSGVYKAALPAGLAIHHETLGAGAVRE